MYPLGKTVETKLRKMSQPVLQGLWKARKTLILTLNALAQLRQGLNRGACVAAQPSPGDRAEEKAGEDSSHKHSTVAGADWARGG